VTSPIVPPLVPTETQLEYLRIALARLFESSGHPQAASLDDWLVLDSFISVAWEAFSPEWRNVFISTWRSYGDQWVRWIHSVSVQLNGRLGLPTDISANLAQAAQQDLAQAVNKEDQDTASHLLPFILRILDGCDPPITMHEVHFLRSFDILDLPDAFGDAQCRARIASLLSTPTQNAPNQIHG
jgi:hypothetical protein